MHLLPPMIFFIVFLGKILSAHAHLSYQTELFPTKGIKNEFRTLPIDDLPDKPQISRALFDLLISEVEDEYAPIFRSQYSSNLFIERDWERNEVNAFTYKVKNRWGIKIFGGLARHPLMTPDAFTMILCHEVGHHVGGSPVLSRYRTTSNEGQADYFASLKCVRRIWKTQNNFRVLTSRQKKGLTISNKKLRLCQNFFQSTEQQALCLRSLIAAENLAEVFRVEFDKSDTPISLFTPDKTIVDQTKEHHSNAQCRLDTMRAGALCPQSLEENVSFANWRKGTCFGSQFPRLTHRPRCWFFNH